ncbi:MAG: M28 family peptidase, partial [Ardenticatenales bacterium]
NNDIVGGAAGEGGQRQPASVRVFSAGDDGGPSRRLARYAAVLADRYADALAAPAGPLAVEVVPQPDRPGQDGDHLAFTDAGFPAIRLVDAVEDMHHQHDPSDTPDRLDPEYHAAVVRLNVALAANLALAPPGEVGAPRIVAESSPPGRYRVSWDALADPVAGYYVAWRRAGNASYAAVTWSATTEAVLDGLPTGAGEGGDVRVAVAAGDDLGHMGVFGAEAGR